MNRATGIVTSMDMTMNDLKPIRLRDYVAMVCPACEQAASLHATLCYKCAGPLAPVVSEKEFAAAVSGHWQFWGQGRLMLNQGGWFSEVFAKEASLATWLEPAAAEYLLEGTCDGFFPRLIAEARDLARRFPRLQPVLASIQARLAAQLRDAGACLSRVRAMVGVSLNPIGKALAEYGAAFKQVVDSDSGRTGRELGLDTILGTTDHLVAVTKAGFREIEVASQKFMAQVGRLPADKLTPDLARAAAEYAAIGQTYHAVLQGGEDR